MPSAFSAASLAAKRAARWRAGPASARAKRELGRGEHALGEPRAALERALEPLDLDQVDADPRRGAPCAGTLLPSRGRRSAGATRKPVLARSCRRPAISKALEVRAPPR